MNGKLFYQCEKCSSFTEAGENDISTYSEPNGEVIDFTTECEKCREKIKIAILIEDE